MPCLFIIISDIPVIYFIIIANIREYIIYYMIDDKMTMSDIAYDK